MEVQQQAAVQDANGEQFQEMDGLMSLWLTFDCNRYMMLLSYIIESAAIMLFCGDS
jgi:hypothetical protein